MKLCRVLLTAAVAPAFFAIAACVPAESIGPNVDTGTGTGGSPGTGGAATGGRGTGGTASGGNGSGGAITGTGGAATGGAATGGSTGTGGAVGTGGAAAGGRGTGGRGSGGSATGGSATGTGGAAGGAGTGTGGRVGTGGSVGTGGTPGATTAEDDGADCTVSSLPEAAALPAIAKLPDPFKKLDGTAMTTKAEWRCRRQEIKRQAEKYVYGTKPPKPDMVTGTVSNTNITVNVSHGGKTSTFSASITLPTTGSAPYAAIVALGGLAGDTATIRSEGVALINYDPFAVGREGTGRASKQGAFYTIYGATSTTGLLVAWAWGVSRIIDVIAQSDGKILKADAVGVTGCSRYGKGAFSIGAFDQRIPLTIPFESGSAGVPIFRGIPGEGAQSLSSAYGEQPWLGDGFGSFTGSPTKLPVDTHEVVAMFAPRGLLILDNAHIANLGPKSAHVAALGGAEVYKALGVGGNISYHSEAASGTHCSVRPEYAEPLRQNIRKFLLKTGTDPGVIKANASTTGNLADWRDWTTPTLN